MAKPGPKRRPIKDRFWPKVDKRGPDECWEWTACYNEYGYGMIAKGGKDGGMERAHLVSWEIHNGPIPDGLCVLHHCDNPHCVNPRHLFLGTKKDNVHDMSEKGRRSLANRARGEHHGSAKLTEKKVRRIRLLLSRRCSQRYIARLFHISQTNVSAINRRDIWAWL